MKYLVFFLLVSSSIFFLDLVNTKQSRPERNTQNLEIPRVIHPRFREDGLEVAVIGDIHAGDAVADYNDLSLMLEKVVRSNPDLILLLGDYTASVAWVSDIDAHRAELTKRFSILTSFPVAAVMGNYEALSNPSKWQRSLSDAGILSLHNDVAVMKVRGQSACIRGLGDAYTGQFKFVDFPGDCDNSTKITITHDPGAAFKKGVKGIIFAAHTHCGQVRLPLVGALWVPSDAPRGATCGRYEDEKRLLWVTSGVGTSILPVRLGAQAQWDFLRLTPQRK